MLHYKLKTWFNHFILAGVICFIGLYTTAQSNDNGLLNYSNRFNASRFKTVLITEVAVAVIATTGLEYLWYKKFPKSHFHFFNDNKEWLNMDKIGHATTAYNISAIQYNAMRWCGVKGDASALIGGITGLAYLSMIEVLDGFSSQWGFSKGDMLANIFGTSLFMGQQYMWHQQRIQLRFSYHTTIFPTYNPGELGSNWRERILKDYNGQSYWLSFVVSSFLKTGNNFPKWVTIDAGYGATGMTGAVINPTRVDNKPVPSFVRKRKVFFSVSGVFAKKGMYPFPSWINIFHIPSPVLELDLGKNSTIKFKPIYF